MISVFSLMEMSPLEVHLASALPKHDARPAMFPACRY